MGTKGSHKGAKGFQQGDKWRLKYREPFRDPKSFKIIANIDAEKT